MYPNWTGFDGNAMGADGEEGPEESLKESDKGEADAQG